MTRHITNSGAFYAFVSRGIGRPAGVAAALVALLSYTCLQVGLYGALGPAAASQAAAHLGVHAAWWAWALAAWAVVTVLGLLRVDITGANAAFVGYYLVLSGTLASTVPPDPYGG